ncbi:S8 family serine peptidase [Limnobacter sp.]|uniref:S8 family serine peptidase n=1 Tax=Limnobacter sp. TaxID=2003368 RepID=UPI003515EC59
MKIIRAVLVMSSLLGSCSSAFSASPYQVKERIADSIIVKMKDLDAHQRGLSSVQARITSTLGKTVLGKTLNVREQLNRNFWVVDISGNPSDAEVLAIIKKLTSGNHGVLSAEPNYYVYPAVFNDPAWESIQKPRLNQSAQSGYNNGVAQFLSAQRTAGASSVVAVVDTGKIPHSDVDLTIANEVNFRPGAPNSEKGNATAGLGSGCVLEQDTAIHHGLSMSSLAVAIRNNNVGMVGFSTAQSYAVRSLARCDGSGTTSEVIKGILWSAGLDMDSGQNFVGNGYPRNDRAATVINLSLGATAAPNQNLCPSGGALHTAVQRAIAAGSVVVAAAGNDYQFVFDGGEFDGQPAGEKLSDVASCEGVVSVGALDFNGGHARYSNVPGQGERLVTNMVVGNGGSQSNATYQATINNGYNYAVGTSHATAMVSGLLASLLDLLGQNRPSNAALLDAIENTGSPFPESDSVCAPSIRDCGTRLDMIALTKALNSTIDVDTVFSGTFSASSFNLTDLAEIVSFQDANGSSEGLTAIISPDGQSVQIRTSRSGTFTLKAGSSSYANRTDRTQLATAEVVISQFGDISVTLADIKRTLAEPAQVVSGATRILGISNFGRLPDQNNAAPLVNDPFEIVDGKIIWSFDGSVNGSYIFDVSYEDSVSAPSSTQAGDAQRTQSTVRSAQIQMVVSNGTPGSYAPRTSPSQGSPGGGGTSAPVASSGGGGGGGGLVSIFGLLGLVCLVVVTKLSEGRERVTEV